MRVHSSVLLFGLAESITALGNWVTQMAVFSLVVFRGGGTVEHSTGILLASLVPAGLVSPLAGNLCDKLDRRALLVVAYGLSSLAVVGLVGASKLSHVYLWLATLGALSSIMIPARQAALRDILAQEELAKSNAFLQQLASVVKIVGPLGGGLLLFHVEPQLAMLLNVAAYLLGIVALLRLPPSPPRDARSSKSRSQAESCRDRSLVPIQRVYRDFPLIRTLTPVVLCLAATMMVFDATTSIIVRDMLQAKEGFLGVLVSLIGLGTLISSTGLVLRKHEGNPWHDLIRGQALLLAIPASVVVAPCVAPGMGRIMVGVLCFIGGLGNGLVTVQTLTLLQLVAPEGAVGRISGIYQGAIAVSQLLAAALTPLLVPAYLSLSGIFGVMTVTVMFLMIRVWLSNRRVVSRRSMAK